MLVTDIVREVVDTVADAPSFDLPLDIRMDSATNYC
jgi:hypothetical protein